MTVEPVTGEAVRVVGAGIDIAEVARFEALLRRGGQEFLARWFHPDEIDALSHSMRADQVALLFATKEAVFKAVRAPEVGQLRWREIVIRSTSGAAPTVALHGRLAEHADATGVTHFEVAQVRQGPLALATALALG